MKTARMVFAVLMLSSLAAWGQERALRSQIEETAAPRMQAEETSAHVSEARAVAAATAPPSTIVMTGLACDRRLGSFQVGKPNLSVVTIQRQVDECSAALLTNTIAPALISVSIKQSNNTGLLTEIDLSSALIASYQLSGYTTDGMPLETVTVFYGKIKVTDQQAGVSACYDQVAGKTC